ncbi:serine/threonine-protein phosphatase [Blastococcus sp. CT_GayMR20]|uniref:PP2C family protein-serine/threonine phosphatase n=1 Tax=Blastococcus sp. CT_GayMR20 TaxID=2559609 RepID=UPI001073FA99|nr:protein phosphatase 2C domain-containing protein [Blastococcus sp. CT_GayMR20]TFV75047.1 serine/threonine-protein phosphatase [Blastococcus sp. CT_GayMR20]
MTALGLLHRRPAGRALVPPVAPRPRPATVASVLESAAGSIPGPRPDNQDAALAGDRVLAVADGVGGNVGGAVAASVAIDRLRQLPDTPGDEPGMRGAVVAAISGIGAVVAARAELAGMATTLTAVALTGDARLVVAHVGDARAYLVRAGSICRLTRDHTFVQGLVDAGAISEVQARTHPLRSVVLRALHGSPGDPAQADVSTHAVEPGDRLLVCSDGLSGVVPAEEILRVLAAEKHPADAVTRLLRSALGAGTRDNVTAVVADVVIGGCGSPAPPAVVGALPPAGRMA